MATLKPADDELREQVMEVIGKHPEFRDLADFSVKFDVLIAQADEKDLDGALYDGGYPVVAKVKVNNHEQRVKGNGDVTLILDDNKFAALENDRQQEAVVYRQLWKLVVKKNRKGERTSDKGGRPVIGIRSAHIRCDWNIRSADKFGVDSPELIEARKMAEDHGQLLMPWVRDWGIDLRPKPIPSDESRPTLFDGADDDEDQDELGDIDEPASTLPGAILGRGSLGDDDPDEDDEPSGDDGDDDGGGDSVPMRGSMSEDPVFQVDLVASAPDGGPPPPAEKSKPAKPPKAPKNPPAPKTDPGKAPKAPKKSTGKPRASARPRP